MGKLTARRTRAHDAAMTLLQKSSLTMGERSQIFRDFEPAADHNVGKSATFFTPFDLALEFTIWGADYPAHYVDIGAGIGMLSFALIATRKEIGSLTCVEINPEFVAIGEKLLPEAKWICGDVFEQETWEKVGCDFDIAISNPPFGRVATTKNRDWLLTGPGEFMVAELALRVANNGAVMIVPETMPYYNLKTRSEQMSRDLERFTKHFPGVFVTPVSGCESYANDWKDVAPSVVIASIDIYNAFPPPPYGLGKLKTGRLL